MIGKLSGTLLEKAAQVRHAQVVGRGEGVAQNQTDNPQ